MEPIALHLSRPVKLLLAEAAIRQEIGDAQFDQNAAFWRVEMENELLRLDGRALHVPSADAHDSTCTASEKYKVLCRALH